MPTLTTPIPEAIEFIGCYTTAFNVQGPVSIRQLLDQPRDTYARLHQSSQFGMDPDQCQAGIKLLIEVDILAEDAKSSLGLRGRFEMFFNFEVPDLQSLATAQPAEGLTEAGFKVALMLTSISYSTARGILMTRLGGTPLDGFALPLIDTAELAGKGELTSTTRLRS